jgi:hypothetical protein
MPTDAFTDDELLALLEVAAHIQTQHRLGKPALDCEIRFLEALRRVGLLGEK